MPYPKFEKLSGVIDGVNPDFTTSVSYQAGTTALYLNGQLMIAAGNPWVETDPSTGLVSITETALIPKVGDVLSAFYMDTTEAQEVDEIEVMVGAISAVEEQSGILEAQDDLGASIDPTAELGGILSTPEDLSGTVGEVDEISGILEDCS